MKKLDKPLKLSFESTQPDLVQLTAIANGRSEKKLDDLKAQLSQLQTRNQKLENENQQLLVIQEKLEKEYSRLVQQLEKLQELTNSK